MPLLNEYSEYSIKYLYVRDDAIGEFKKGYRVAIFTPSAVIRGLQIAQRAEHQEHIKRLDEQWETNNLALNGLIAQRNREIREVTATNKEQAETIINHGKEISFLKSKLQARDAQLKHLKERNWWERLFERNK